MIICASAMVYWIKQLRNFEDAGTESKDTTALFLNNIWKSERYWSYFKSFQYLF
jgi:hypothetical protein